MLASKSAFEKQFPDYKRVIYIKSKVEAPGHRELIYWVREMETGEDKDLEFIE